MDKIINMTDVNGSLFIISKIFSFALLLQCIEMIIISKNSVFIKIWNFQNIESTLKYALPFPAQVLNFIFSENYFRILLFIELILIVFCFFVFHPILILLTAFLQLLVCMRFRGTFNGGSDMMVFVTAAGLIIGGKVGLIYIAIHATYSYFKAGLVKVKQKPWLNGNVLTDFLRISLYSDIQSAIPKLKRYPKLGKILSWGTLVFELSLPLIFLIPNMAFIYLSVAVSFHLIIYFTFGLNRFFWIWLSTWPAILFTAHSI